MTMKKLLALVYLLVLTAAIPGITAAQISQSAHIGYVYPAGGQVGTTFEVVIGGKGLSRVQAIHVTGSGVDVKFIEHVANYKRKLQEQMRFVGRKKSGRPEKAGQGKERKFGEPPEHEMYTRLEDLSKREFKQVANKFASKEKVQRNRELDELVILEITIDKEARPGMRELRLLTQAGGASNPVRFMVNTLPEASEYEPNDLKSPPETYMQLPFIMNGQIMPGDEDRFSFSADEGQSLVISVQARALVPFLADAVPGWFQAVVKLLDDKGNELEYADDFMFSPDPAFLFEVPETGDYQLVIRDSIYRGREDFVYRVAVGEIPFVTGIFPLGARAGTTAEAALYGWNLGAPRLSLDSGEPSAHFSEVYIRNNGNLSNIIRHAISSMPESIEEERNDTIKSAEDIKFRSVMNGRIGERGDADFYRFRARKEQVIKITVTARQLHSPLDSLLRVFNKNGQVLAWNDDVPPAGNMTDRVGLLTHHSDSELTFTAPTRGTYYVQVSDSQDKGGDTYAYRLSLTDPQPDYEVYIAPSTITIPGSSGGKATLHVRRIDDFDGPVDVGLGSASRRFSLSGGRIPAGQDSVPIVISRKATTGTSKPINYRGFGDGWRPVKTTRSKQSGIDFASLDLTASATIGENTVSRPVVPTDEITQAFITYHLVKAGGLNAFTASAPRQQPFVRLKDSGPLSLIPGESVRLNTRSGNLPKNVSGPLFELESAPAGLVLSTSGDTGKAVLELTANAMLEPDLEGNLLVAVYFEVSPRSKEGKGRTRRISAGYLPAIPYRTGR